ncbi:MAPEG family protein [Synechococcus sp. MIT S9508]|nr:MAPEG family protein [Synechococcus sp. MIT S9508]
MVILSIVPLYEARFKAQFEMSDLSSLRAMFDRYLAWGKRASWSQQNSFESFSLHAPVAILAILVAMNGLPLPAFAVVVAFVHPILRAAYLVSYLVNISLLRSVCWVFASLCSGFLYGVCLSAIIST